MNLDWQTLSVKNDIRHCAKSGAELFSTLDSCKKQSVTCRVAGTRGHRHTVTNLGAPTAIIWLCNCMKSYNSSQPLWQLRTHEFKPSAIQGHTVSRLLSFLTKLFIATPYWDALMYSDMKSWTSSQFHFNIYLVEYSLLFYLHKWIWKHLVCLNTEENSPDQRHYLWVFFSYCSCNSFSSPWGYVMVYDFMPLRLDIWFSI